MTVKHSCHGQTVLVIIHKTLYDSKMKFLTCLNCSGCTLATGNGLVLISQQAITWAKQDHYLLLHHIDGLVQEKRNSSVLAMELSLSCTDPLIWSNAT